MDRGITSTYWWTASCVLGQWVCGFNDTKWQVMSCFFPLSKPTRDFRQQRKHHNTGAHCPLVVIHSIDRAAWIPKYMPHKRLSCCVPFYQIHKRLVLYVPMNDLHFLNMSERNRLTWKLKKMQENVKSVSWKSFSLQRRWWKTHVSI